MAERLFFSADASHRIGSFDHGLGLIDVSMTDEAIELLRKPATVSAYRNEPLRLKRRLLELTNYAHEHRHYLDTFGTLSGIGVYAARLGCIGRFTDVALQLLVDGVAWRLPLSAWAREPDCPPPVRRLLRFVRSHRIGADFFFGAYPRFTVAGHRKEAWLDLPVHHGTPAQAPQEQHPQDQGYHVPAFPFSMAIARQGAGGEPSVRPFTVVYPIGYEALLEGTAQAMARELVETMFPSVPYDFLVEHRQVGQHDENEDDEHRFQRIADALPPYNVTDLLVSKYLRGHGIDKFPRELLLKLTDAGLASGGLQLRDVDDTTTMAHILCPARAFVDQLAETPAQRLGRGETDFPQACQDAYAGLLAAMRKGGDWQTVARPDAIYSAVRVWESFLAQNVTVPLLQKRIDTGHASFQVQDQAVQEIFDMGRPCVQVFNGKIEFRHVPPPVQTAWARQMMLGEITQQLFNDATTFLCPRANRLLPGMDSVDFAHGHCNRNERRGCGSWAPGRDAEVPDCMFRECLAAYGFIAGPGNGA